MVHHDLEILLLGQLDQLFGLRGVAGEGLLDKDVLAILQRRFGQLVVRPDRRDNGDGIDLGDVITSEASAVTLTSRICFLRRSSCSRHLFLQWRSPVSPQGSRGSSQHSVPNIRIQLLQSSRSFSVLPYMAR